MDCKCKRCGFEWQSARLWDYRLHRPVKNHVPKRCARCRSKYWNKEYVRDYRQTGLLNSGSVAFQPSLLIPSHDAGIMRRKLFSGPDVRRKNPADLNEKDFRKLLDEVNPVVPSLLKLSRPVKAVRKINQTNKNRKVVNYGK